jgi:hypothetical protein
MNQTISYQGEPGANSHIIINEAYPDWTHVVDVGDAARDRVLDRDHAQRRRAVLHRRQRVLEGGSWPHGA